MSRKAIASNAISKMLPITTADRIPADERAKIDAAIPRQPLAKPRQARKLLIIDVCPAGGFYHTTVAHGNLMLQLIGKYTGAYEAVFDNNLENLRYPHIKQYDAVFLEQRRRYGVLRSRSARRADPLRQAKAAAWPVFTAPRSRRRICASSAS